MATLKASQQGIVKIKQARREKGWSVDDFRWVESASQVLGVCWEKRGVLALGISEGTWKRFLSGKYAINTDAFKAFCQVLELNWEEIVDRAKTEQLKQNRVDRDWGEAPDVTNFFGRDRELNTVKRWILQENCRLIMLLGMGGIGKTTISVKLAQQAMSFESSSRDRGFELVIWRSLRNTRTLDEILTELIQFISQQQETNLPTSFDAKILLLLKYLRSSRCLLILDNVESILQPGDRTGSYREGYQNYGQLFQRIGETQHQSCLILTSREKPKGLAALEGENLPVRCLQLSGLASGEIREIFQTKGSFTASEKEWSTLVERYAGNPLALKIVASAVKENFDGDISLFINFSPQSPFLFDDIQELLKSQFDRLSQLEKEIMYWLAIEREAISLPELLANFVAKIPPRELLESLSCLQRRSLIEKGSVGFTQQPVVMEYVIERLIENVAEEIIDRQTFLWKTHALIKAQAKEYITQTQISLILKPLADRLITNLGSPEQIANSLKQIIVNLQGKSPQETGYAAGNTLNLLHHLQVDLTGYDFSRLTVWQGYLQGVNLHDVNFTDSDLSSCVFTETLGNILSATFSPDGKLMATCDTDCHVKLWQVQTGQLVMICQGHVNWVRSIAFSPDGKILASCGADCLVKLWNVEDGICLKTFSGHEHEVFSVVFSPDGRTLASGSGDLTIKLWDVLGGNCLKTLTGHTDWVRSVAFNPNGETLASSGSDRAIKFWDITSGKCWQTLDEHQNAVRSIAFSPDGKVLASGSCDRTVKLWDCSTGKCLKTYTGHRNGVYSVAFSSTPINNREGEEGILVSGSGDHTAKLWNWQTHTCIRTLHGHSNEVCSVAFNSDGYTLVCVSLDQTVRLWDCRNGQCLKTWYGHTDWALPVAYSPDGKILASGSNDKTVRLWDSSTGNCIGTLQGHGDFIYGLAFSPISFPLVKGDCRGIGGKGGILASASTDSSVRLWSIDSAKCWQILQGHTDWVYTVAFHQEGQTLVSGSADCNLKIWNWRSGQCLKTLSGHTDKILGISFSPEGKILASASADRTVKLWDYQNGSCIKTLRGHTKRIYAAVFSPDGQILATCSTDRTIKLWDWQQEKCLKTLTGHTNWVFSVAFSPDGQTLVSASHDHTVRIWDVKTGMCRHICQGHTHLVSSVAFNPNGESFASGSQDQTVRIWDASTGECLKILRAKRLYERMNLKGVHGLTESQIYTLKALGALA